MDRHRRVSPLQEFDRTRGQIGSFVPLCPPAVLYAYRQTVDGAAYHRVCAIAMSRIGKTG